VLKYVLSASCFRKWNWQCSKNQNLLSEGTLQSFCWAICFCLITV